MNFNSTFSSNRILALYTYFSAFFGFLAYFFLFPLQQEVPVAWETEEISDGIIWKSYHGDDFYESTQGIQVLEIDFATASVTASFGASDSALIHTSEFGRQHGALAAVNGSFFNMREGGSVVFFKKNNEIRHPGAENQRRYNENGGIAIDNAGRVSISPRPDDSWRTISAPHLLSSGPLLIIDGEIQPFNNDPFNQNRHPRTAVGITEDERLILVTVDGRSNQAHGMSIPELAEFMASLGSASALNLDGGGSTTMWIEGKGESGVVSYPSDNGQFDHAGERGVANVLLIIPDN